MAMTIWDLLKLYLNSLKSGKSHAVDKWLLMGGPAPIAIILAIYTCFAVAGPRVMLMRRAIRTNNLVLYFHNMSQIGMSFGMMLMIHIRLDLLEDGWQYPGCRYSRFSLNTELLATLWWFILIKITELMTTVFIILRRKQLTGMTVYNQISTVILYWSWLKYGAGGDTAVFAYLNSFVSLITHVHLLATYRWWIYDRMTFPKRWVERLHVSHVLITLFLANWLNTARCQFSPEYLTFVICHDLALLTPYVFNKADNKANIVQVNEDDSYHRYLNSEYTTSILTFPSSKTEKNTYMAVHRSILWIAIEYFYFTYLLYKLLYNK